MRRHLLSASWLLILVSGLVLVSAFVLVKGHVGAAEFGRNLDEQYYVQKRLPGNNKHGYAFANSPDIDYQGISQNWQTQAMTVDIFISEMQKRLNSPTPANAARASAIINMMMGHDGDDASFNTPSSNRWQNGVAVAKSQYGQWESLVRAYASGAVPGASVNFNDVFSAQNPADWLGIYDSDDYGNQYPDIYYSQLDETFTSEPDITFYNADGSQFRLLKKCGNPAGPEAALKPAAVTPQPTPQPPPPPAVKPYVSVKGGDVSAGARFVTPSGSDSQPCGSNHVANAGIAAWSNHGDHSGAGTTYAASAFGSILDFVTAQSPGSKPYKLALANTAGVDEAAGVYGGSFDSGPCIDYWSKKPTSGTVKYNGGPVSALNGNYVNNGPAAKVIISASSIANGNHSTIYINGDVAITGNITYAGGGGTWNSRADIPSFKLIVHGTIYVDASVTQLDGTYAAIPDATFPTAKNEFSSPIPGTITTCAIGGFASYDPSDYRKDRIESACSKKLVINGSLAANQIWFLRSSGSINGPLQPAETVNYVPDSWIAPGSGGSSVTIDNGTYQSIVGLPPVL